MKNKKLLLLGTFALVFTSGLAAAGTTFAWYQTNRNASLTFSSAQIENLDSHLLVTHLGNQSDIANTGTDNKLVYDVINRVTDVSGNGVNLYKPHWTSNSNIASSIAKVEAEDHFIDIFVKVERWHEYDAGRELDDVTGFEQPYGLKVYLGGLTEFLPASSEPRDENAVKALRMAVLEYDSEGRGNEPKINLLYAPDPDGDDVYLVNKPGGAYGQSNFSLVEPADDNSLLTAVPDIKTGTIATKDTIEDADEDGFLVADLTSVNVAYIAFRFWIEGEDDQTVRSGVESSLGGAFSINLEIYALQPEII